MQTRKWVAAVAAGLVLTTASCGIRDDEDAATTNDDKAAKADGPTLELTSPADGATIQGNVVRLDLESTDIDIVKADGDTSGDSGHYHVFVDMPAVAAGEAIPKAKGVIHSADDPVVVSGLAPGSHTFTVVLGNGAHERIGSEQAKVKVTVAGPSVEASLGTAPLVAGQPINVEMTATGVEIKKADGDVSGKSGHFHVFVDKDPATVGQVIPAGDPNIIHSATSPVAVPGLSAGEHTIWVVVGDGAHKPLDPPVMHKLTFTVT